ncbi:MAG TPA: patatin-like phospholipase family protein [Burkholderiaceae bacterium]|nr:patatin-like phospholipase family protein [Burkholderiaceae bacterium]HQR69988.1 patatin-like phospholipase family protein [Burkholderiaceae bacterium]
MTGHRERRAPRARRPAGPIVNLALQGGGSHGAFTWGVLDSLLEDGRLRFEGITGASAGAMNAVVLAEGWRRGRAAGRDPAAEARSHLGSLWEKVGALPNVFAATSVAPALAQGAATLMDLWSLFLTPYQLNPFDYNPLRELLDSLVDFEALRADAPFKLFVCATNVRSGRARVFREYELTCDMLLASTALPTSFRAVEIDGEAYWDGGYMGNPALYPLFYATRTADLLLVPINPLNRPELPSTPQDILERINEISFNAALLHELRAIAFVQRLLDEQRVDPKRYKRVNLHMIEAEDALRSFGAATKSDTSPGFIADLHAIGRAAASDWLDRSIHYVGHAPGVRIAERFL